MGENTRQNCTRQNKKKNPGRQQACWGSLFCTNLTQPTGNLDEETAMSIMQILEDSVHQMNKCAVIVTHSNEIAKKADVVFQLKRGTLHIVKNNEKV